VTSARWDTGVLRVEPSFYRVSLAAISGLLDSVPFQTHKESHGFVNPERQMAIEAVFNRSERVAVFLL